jgi:hypothetical protein
MAASAVMETPAEARVRRTNGGPTPPHYRPRQPAADGPKGPNIQPTVYGGGEERKKAAGT